ncbi:MAG TPA: RNase A-like domain-containing protein [Candidatus Acidoferrum sp.]|nr:RNase A-like domain-containing protein [Candidatus Acidoferrum sp.]
MRKPGGKIGAVLWLVLLFVLPVFGLGSCTQRPQLQTGSSEEAQRASSSSAGRAAERYDLSDDEKRGGHTLARHVARTDEELRERLRREGNISAASTWTDRETAEETIAEALRSERRRIESWMRRGYPRANLALHHEARRDIGRSLRQGETEAVRCHDAVIVLRADGPDTFYVLTAYPETRE